MSFKRKIINVNIYLASIDLYVGVVLCTFETNDLYKDTIRLIRFFFFFLF